MKKIVFVIWLVLVGCFNAQCQKVFPDFSSKPKWNVVESDWMDGTTRTYQYAKDTSFCGHIYSTHVLAWGWGKIYCRTDSLKVYLRGSTDSTAKEYLLYDYSLKVGDFAYVGYEIMSQPWRDTMKVTVVSVDSVTYFGVRRKRLQVSYDKENKSGNYFKMYWIEGIGSDLNPFYSAKPIHAGCECGYELLCFHSGNIQLYQKDKTDTCFVAWTGIKDIVADNSLKISPNPFSSSFNIELNLSSTQQTKIELCSLDGKLLKEVYNGILKEGKNELQVNCPFASGVYMLRLITKEGVMNSRLVKME